jgi:riboflavin biosynthesis pyrimidine reductase
MKPEVLSPMTILSETDQDVLLPLTNALGGFYGPLMLPVHPGRPHVIANLVTTLDGVVAFDVPGRAGGGDISGHNAHDRALMGLLRAIAGAVVVGAGTLRAEPRHIWTPEHIFPPFADEYQKLREALEIPESPLNVLVSARGDLDLSWPVFQSGKISVLIISTIEGVSTLRKHTIPAGVALATAGTSNTIRPRAILDAVEAARPSEVILLEGGPRLLGDFMAAHLLDEQFLTLAPQIAGRDGKAARPGLTAGHLFAPKASIWSKLMSVRQAGDHLFLRYKLPHA